MCKPLQINTHAVLMFQWEAEEAKTIGEFKTAYLAGIDKKLFGKYNKLYSLNAFTSKTLYFFLLGDPIWVRYGPEEAFGYLQLPFSQVGLDMV